MKKPSYQVIPIDSWANFINKVSSREFVGWAFRGQSNSKWKLYSKLSRHLMNFKIDQSVWIRQEERIIRIFTRKAHYYLEHLPSGKQLFRWLALMQHHGSPTRLFDLTWSPYVAAFFALEHATKKCAVWALNPPCINLKSLKLNDGSTINPKDMGPWKIGNLEKHFFKNKIPFVNIGEPYMMNQRLIMQKGTFAIPGVLDKPIEELLAAYPEPENTLVKFELRTSSIRVQALRDLYDMNINNATLFPDSDGLAKSLEYELEFSWAVNTRTGKPIKGFEDYTAEDLFGLKDMGKYA